MTDALGPKQLLRAIAYGMEGKGKIVRRQLGQLRRRRKGRALQRKLTPRTKPKVRKLKLFLEKELEELYLSG